VDVTRLVEYRLAHKDEFQARHGFALSYVPFFIQIVCDALIKNPYLNSTWTDEGILLKHYINMGIAVALPETHRPSHQGCGPDGLYTAGARRQRARCSRPE
jgi:pyruvate/2-oxoglutarate dehydrogenase complex dihydrolipoamide acyltransferase (E2) component